MQNNIPAPNPAVRELMLSSWMRSLMHERAEIAQALYREIVAKRTGNLARSARVETFKGGRNKDRWCGRLIVGDNAAHYAASHEFGYDAGDSGHQEGHRDLNAVLNQMAAL